MLDRSEIEATIMRVAYAAFTYYPEKSRDLKGYRVDEDVEWCMAPMRNLSPGFQAGFRDRIRLLIVDPVQDRQLFIHDLMALESPESKFRDEK